MAGKRAVHGVLIDFEGELQEVLVAGFVRELDRCRKIAERNDVRTGDGVVGIDRVDQLAAENHRDRVQAKRLGERKRQREIDPSGTGPVLDRAIPVGEIAKLERLLCDGVADGQRLEASDLARHYAFIVSVNAGVASGSV